MHSNPEQGLLFSVYLTPVYQQGVLQQIQLSRKKPAPAIEPLPLFCRFIKSWLDNPALVILPEHKLQGTDYQKNIWQYLLTIPPGSTQSYAQVARHAGGSALSVGQTLKHNPLPLLYPCHRVVAKQGLGGYAGKTQGWLTEFKQALIEYEQGFDRSH